MALSNDLSSFKDILDRSARPLFFFDNDCDGTCAFLQAWRYKKEGKGHPTGHALGTEHLKKVREYAPDLIVALDIAVIDEEFVRGTQTPILWLDHHPLQTKVHTHKNVTFINPRVYDPSDGAPTSSLVYHAIGNKDDLWIAAAGTVSDWHLGPVADLFAKTYPDLLDTKSKNAARVIYTTPLGKLIRIITFSIKGRVSDMMTSVKILTRIATPYELLEQETPRARFLLHKYERINKEYQSLLQTALETRAKHNLFTFTYKEKNTSFTADLSNELLFRKKGNVILVAREAGDLFIFSLRVPYTLHEKEGINAQELLHAAMKGLDGSGGGHPTACGGSIRAASFDQFTTNLRSILAKQCKKTTGTEQNS